MYRLLTIESRTVHNFKLTFGRNAVENVQLLWKAGNAGGSKAIYSQLLQQEKSTEPLTRKTGLLAVTATPTPTSAAAVTPLSLRLQSTTSTNAEAETKKKKKRKPRYAKYVELLEVTENAANERKSRVKRLKAKKLQEFIAKARAQILEKRAKAEKQKKPKPVVVAQQPIEYQKINMEALDASILETGCYDDKPLIFFGKEEHTTRVIDNPQRIQNILKSFTHFRDIIETIEHEGHEANAELGSYSLADFKTNETEGLEESFETVEPYVPGEIAITETEADIKPAGKVTKATAKAKQRYKSKIHNSLEHERLAKNYALRLNLNTYLDVCVSVGMLNRALSTLLSYRQRAKKHSNNLITVEMYNTLLRGFAEKGSFDRFKNVFAYMQDDNLPFNEQTFAAIFECLGRLEPTERNNAEIKDYIDKAKEMGYTLDAIMDRSKFMADQRDIALDAIQRIYPDFRPTYPPPPLGYINPLINHLNENVQPLDATHENMLEKEIKFMNSKRGYAKETLEQMAREQLKIELDGSITIASIEKPPEYANAEYCRDKLNELRETWRTYITAAINRDLNTLKAQVRNKPNGYMNYYTYLRTLDATQYSDILLKEIFKLAEGSETYSPTVWQLYKELGLKVQQRFQVEQKKKSGVLEKTGDIYSSYCDIWADGHSNYNIRQIWQQLVHQERHSGPSMDIRDSAWPTNVLTGVGRFLYNILMRDITIDTNVMRQKSKKRNCLPAFYTLFRNQGRFVKEEVKPHPVLARLLRASRQPTLTFDSHLVPMLCPPKPWNTTYNGGYLINNSDLIRLPYQAVQQMERIDNTNPQEIYPALDSLNQLASVPWRVNQNVLDIIVKVFQNGGDAKLNVPQPPSSLPPLPTMPEKNSSVSNEERAKHFREKLGYRRKQAEMYSLWCDTLYRLSLANHYRDKVFWLPHNMDFRGRVYPIPPHLNHLGSDLARSMLVFDQAQPLGADGFSWLKLHCINLTGLKKRDSIRERLMYAEDIMEEILDSADNPLDGRMWWARSDEPWQTLACCIEIAKVHRSPDPAAYMSRFPIHQDGSCNGLQHYAALGRDENGAISVNLANYRVPQDVYSAVAALVEKSRKVDAKNGLHVAQALDGFIRRKVIKQTVMTTVYGVTRYGARLQIARQLKDIEDFPKDWVWPASTYLTTKTFESLREMFTSTREIQDWFTDCARLISGVGGQNVEWITPLGLPVVQPYNRQDARPAKSTSVRVTETMVTDLFERPNVMKQKNAFPPNFIHSLDSTHMMLTSLHCERQGLTFVSVHDCFWTHACTVPDMNKICREQFVALHSQPILEDLSKFLIQKYSFKETELQNDESVEGLSKRNLNRVLRKVPSKGEFDLNNILQSIYFFS